MRANTQHRGSYGSHSGVTQHPRRTLGNTRGCFWLLQQLGLPLAFRRVWARDIKNLLHFVEQFFMMINAKILRHMSVCVCVSVLNVRDTEYTEPHPLFGGRLPWSVLV